MVPAAREALLARLDAFAPADAAESVDLARIRELVVRSPRPFDRRELTPGHLTCSALVRHPARDAVAVVHHRRLGLWLQPGGHAEPGEEELEAIARREVLEETGLRCEGPARLLDVDVHAIPANEREAAHEHFDLRVLLVATDDALVVRPEESLGVRWATYPELEALGADHGLLRAARKALGTS